MITLTDHLKKKVLKDNFNMNLIVQISDLWKKY